MYSMAMGALTVYFKGQHSKHSQAKPQVVVMGNFFWTGGGGWCSLCFHGVNLSSAYFLAFSLLFVAVSLLVVGDCKIFLDIYWMPLLFSCKCFYTRNDRA